VAKKLKNTGQNLESFKTEKKMIIPTGKLFGALPDYIFIDGVEWRCIATASIEGKTYDKIRNTETKEIKKVERFKLLTFLQKKLVQ
jgi:hypothetical protein